MNKNFCSNCSTENESEYVYCKNCGAQLKPEKESAPINSESKPQINAEPVTAPPYEGYQNNNNGYNSVNFDGVSTEEMNLYIGKKANDIMPKFIKMQITGSKVSWCWPAAILGFLFGPLGAAFWFFYRKMYKKAGILTIIGTIITFVITIFTPSLPEDFVTSLESAFETLDIEAIMSAVGNMDVTSLISYYAVTLIEDISSITTGVLCGIFGFYWYKNDCVAKIINYRTAQQDPRYYRFGLTAIGGTSGGMLALSIAIYCIINTAASITTAIISLF